MYLIQFFYKVGEIYVIARIRRNRMLYTAKMQTSRLPHCVRNDKMMEIDGQLRQQVRYLRVFPLKIPSEIEHDTGEEVNDQRKADSQK